MSTLIKREEWLNDGGVWCGVKKRRIRYNSGRPANKQTDREQQDNSGGMTTGTGTHDDDDGRIN